MIFEHIGDVHQEMGTSPTRSGIGRNRSPWKQSEGCGEAHRKKKAATRHRRRQKVSSDLRLFDLRFPTGSRSSHWEMRDSGTNLVEREVTPLKAGTALLGA